MSKKNKLDQYYTKPQIAEQCWGTLQGILPNQDFTYVEPSAGSGNFMFENVSWEAYDLSPQREGIVQKDFLTVKDLEGKVVVGNPPFGFASSLALKFINHSAEQGAKYIAFILPKTFKKTLFKDKVNRKLHLVYEDTLPKKSFLLEGEAYDVPCVFQIWESKEFTRSDLVFDEILTKGTSDDYDFLLRRVGGRAGRVLNEDDFTESSSLYVKGDPNWIVKYQDDIASEASNTVGVRSITLNEINYIISKGEV